MRCIVVITAALALPLCLAGRTVNPLIRAVKRKELDEVIAVIDSIGDYSIDLDSVDEDKRSALHWAVAYQQPAIVQLLRDNGAHPNGVDADGHTPYTLAQQTKQEYVQEILQSAWSQLHTFAMAADVEGIRSALKRKVDRLRFTDAKETDWQGATAIHYASRACCRECVEELLSAGADINALTREGDSPLMWAASSLDVECVEFLLDVGASPNAYNDYEEDVTSTVVRAAGLRIAEAIYEDSAPVEDSNETPTPADGEDDYYEEDPHTDNAERVLSLDERIDNYVQVVYELLETLVKFGADTSRPKSSKTLLHFAADTDGCQKLLKMLVEIFHVDPNRLALDGLALDLARMASASANAAYLKSVTDETAAQGGDGGASEPAPLEGLERVTINPDDLPPYDFSQDEDVVPDVVEWDFQFPNGTQITETGEPSKERFDALLEEHFKHFPEEREAFMAPACGGEANDDEEMGGGGIRVIDEDGNAVPLPLVGEEDDDIEHDHVEMELKADGSSL